MRLRLMNMADNPEYMAEFGVKGIYTTEENPRLVCSCGEISKHDKSKSPVCPHCGNAEFKNVYRHYGSRSVVASSEKLGTYFDDTTIPQNVVAYKNLIVIIDVPANRFIFQKEWQSAIEVEDDSLLAHNNFSNRTLLRDYFLAHKDELCTEYQLDLLEKALELEEIMYVPKKSEKQKDMYDLELYYKIAYSISQGKIKLSNEQFIRSKNKWTTNFLTEWKRSKIKNISCLKDILEILKMPDFLEDYYLDNDISGYYLDLRQLSEKIIDKLQNVIKYAAMHGQLDSYELSKLISNAAGLDKNLQEDFADFFVKNIGSLKSDVFNSFIHIKEVIDTINPRPPMDLKIAKMVSLERYMKARGINEVRADAIIDILDKDPMVVLDLLSERKKLTPEEKKRISDTMK